MMRSTLPGGLEGSRIGLGAMGMSAFSLRFMPAGWSVDGSGRSGPRPGDVVATATSEAGAWDGRRAR
nr:hypothetical protein GCM10010200_035200 [Actinomadura rugatobispora]